MPISPKTPLAERAPKSATGSRAGHSADRTKTFLPPGILDQMQDAVFTTDLEGYITSCNRGVDRYGVSPKDLIGKHLADFCGMDPEALAATRAIPSVLENGRFEGELHCRTKAGTVGAGVQITARSGACGRLGMSLYAWMPWTASRFGLTG